VFLSSISIKNFRSIVDSGNIHIERFQALVGENNCGKSNILHAINVFLTAGAGGIKEKDFYNATEKIVIASTFTNLTAEERKELRRYLIGDKIILEKHIFLEKDDKSQKSKVSAEYHGYLATPEDWWLSIEGVSEEKGNKPDWKAIAEEHGILEYVQTTDGKVNKASYGKGLEQLLLEKDNIKYKEPVLGETQALGIPQNLLARLPEFYLLPAVTDYSDEIDKRSSSTVFRRLMRDLGDRIIKLDPKYNEIEEALNKIDSLLNSGATRSGETGRLKVMDEMETALKNSIKGLMPSVKKVSLEVEIEGTGDIFARGIQLGVDDGKMTDVLDKGHGLQRCVVFGLLKTLILNERGGLVKSDNIPKQMKPIILAIEEPELYIHPQLERIIFQVLKEFASTTGTQDQIIYSTHSPSFVDVWAYHKIGVVRKDNVEIGTKVHQCKEGILAAGDPRKDFQLLNSFGLDKNRMFFSRHTVLVEGEQDTIAILATGRSMKLFNEFPEEIGYTVIETDNKEQMPKFQKLLNAFELPYTVLLELDNKEESEDSNKHVLEQLNGNKCVKHPQKLEYLIGKEKHFQTTYHAKRYFSEEKNLTDDLKNIVKELFPIGLAVT
jgi:hypothetical protein